MPGTSRALPAGWMLLQVQVTHHKLLGEAQQGPGREKFSAGTFGKEDGVGERFEQLQNHGEFWNCLLLRALDTGERLLSGSI